MIKDSKRRLRFGGGPVVIFDGLSSATCGHMHNAYKYLEDTVYTLNHACIASLTLTAVMLASWNIPLDCCLIGHTTTRPTRISSSPRI